MKQKILKLKIVLSNYSSLFQSNKLSQFSYGIVLINFYNFFMKFQIWQFHFAIFKLYYKHHITKLSFSGIFLQCQYILFFKYEFWASRRTHAEKFVLTVLHSAFSLKKCTAIFVILILINNRCQIRSFRRYIFCNYFQ